MRVDAFFAERRTLPNAETVLLINDRKTETLERDALLDQRVRADDDLELARCEVGEDLLAGRAGDARGEQRVTRTTREKNRERTMMLLRQQLRRRHERRLRTGGHRDARGQRRDHGLARSHVALEQARHRHAFAEVLADLVERTALARGQRER